jgi:hypothetical protein
MSVPPPRVFISYSHDSPEHKARVRQLGDSLKLKGLNVQLDTYQSDDPPERWPLWMERQLEYAQKVLLVCTETYSTRVKGEEVDGIGMGVCWEANQIYTELYLSQMKSNKFIPVLFDKSHRGFIPKPLRTHSFFVIEEDGTGFEKLLRHLLGRVNEPAPATGSIPDLALPQPLAPFILPDAATSPEETKPVNDEPIDQPLQPGTEESSEDAEARRLIPNKSPAQRFDLKELDWYDEADAGFFHGRDGDVKAIRTLLLDQPVTRLFGPSGVGKSSILRAGLIPDIRRLGFRAAVVRPFADPTVAIPRQISEQLLTKDSPALPSTLDLATLRRELAPALQAENARFLFLLIDQVEDVVSPLVPPDARERLVDFLQQVWQADQNQLPIVKVLITYRTDSDSRLGPLWQEVSGNPAGLPYHTVSGLTKEIAVRVIDDVAKQWDRPLPRPASELVEELAVESRTLDTSGNIFPPYLQMLLARLSAASEEESPGDDTEDASPIMPSSAGDLIGDYMRLRLKVLEERGGDFRKSRPILESLSRSSGQKLTLTLGEIAAEVRLTQDAVLQVVEALQESRLIRSAGPESYEIQHDRLAGCPESCCVA